MQTVETLNEDLKGAYTLTITAKDIDKRVDAEVKRVAPQVRMPGFRPGKGPTNLIRRMHGEALMQDALNSSIQEGVQKVIAITSCARRCSRRSNSATVMRRSEEHTSELQSLMRNSYAVFCLKNKNETNKKHSTICYHTENRQPSRLKPK